VWHHNNQIALLLVSPVINREVHNVVERSKRKLKEVEENDRLETKLKNKADNLEVLMPIYEYECKDCTARFELKRRFGENSGVSCPLCQGEARRVFCPVSILFKGSGFYVTDNANTERNPSTDRNNGDRPSDDGTESKPVKESK